MAANALPDVTSPAFHTYVSLRASGLFSSYALGVQYAQSQLLPYVAVDFSNISAVTRLLLTMILCELHCACSAEPHSVCDVMVLQLYPITMATDSISRSELVGYMITTEGHHRCLPIRGGFKRHTQQPTSLLRTRSYMVRNVVTMTTEKRIPSSIANDCINAHTNV